jgi:hypothetical protein
MSEPTADHDPFEVVAASFLARYRAGERPSIVEYAARYPELADEIRDLFPALLMMEDLGESSGGTTGSLAAADGPVVAARLERLGGTTASSARSAGAAWAWARRPSRSRWAAAWP